MTELTQQRKEQPGEILETLTELQEFITRLARSALLAGEHCPESDTDAFYSEACKAMNNLAWVIGEFQEGRSSLESENARLREALKKNDICVKCLKRFSGKHCESV